MKKSHLFFANLIFITHCLLAVFILTGWLFPTIKIYYVTTLFVWILSWIFLQYCPLTRWELLLRKKYDQKIDPDTEIIQFYLKKVLKKDISKKTILIIGMCVFCVLLLLTQR